MLESVWKSVTSEMSLVVNSGQVRSSLGAWCGTASPSPGYWGISPCWGKKLLTEQWYLHSVQSRHLEGLDGLILDECLQQNDFSASRFALC